VGLRSFRYGALSKKEILCEDYFEHLAAEHPNFDFHIALSDPMEEDAWAGSTGFIHEAQLSFLDTLPLIRVLRKIFLTAE